MRNDALIIEGKVVDLGATNIALEFVSNLWSDPSKISASHSYTLTLPRTAHNERVMDYCTSVAHRSQIVGAPLRAQYLRNGLTIARNATAEVNSVTADGIEIVLYWDGLSAFSAWLARAPKLRELDIPEYRWTGTTSGSARILDDVIEGAYNTGVSSRIMSPPPAVNCFALFKRIMDGIGAPWVRPDADIVGEMQRLVIPLCSRAGTLTPSLGGQWDTLNASGHFIGSSEMYIEPEGNIAGSMVVVGEEIRIPDTIAKVDVSVRAEWFAEDVDEEDDGYFGDAYLNIYNASRTLIASRAMTRSADFRSVSLDADIPLEGVSGYITIAIETGNEYIGALRSEGLLTIVPTTKTATVGAWYSIAGNLPDITQLEYIKALCSLFGLQMYNTLDGSLGFASLETLYANIESDSVRDWTRKIVDWREGPNGIGFKVGDYAQHNTFKYKADAENLGTNADGVLDVGGRALPLEKDAVALPFAATRGNTIRHYSAEYDSDTGVWRVDDTSVEPRILRTSAGTDGKVHLSFDGSQSWGSVLTRYYGALSRVLEYPVQISAYATLTEQDLATLDYVRPVYLQQTGKYYAVAKIVTDATTEISEITLIQL